MLGVDPPPPQGIQGGPPLGQGRWDSSEPRRQFVLNRESELRCEVDWEASLAVTLVSGTAEVFGTELAAKRPVTFGGGEKIAVFTWHGAVIDVEGTPALPDGMYVSDETPMVSYLNVHGVLNVRRVEACKMNAEREALLDTAGGADVLPVAQGPRVMLVGPTDSGKSALARIFLNYAARQDWRPTWVDLDVSMNSVSIPGSMAATVVDAPMELPSDYSEEMPLAFFYGHINPAKNVEVYRALVTQMGEVIEGRMARHPEAASSGMVVNSMGWVEGSGYQILLHSIDALKVDVVLVLGHEKLYSMLADVHLGAPAPDGRRVSVVKLAKSGGVVQRPKNFRLRVQTSLITRYFEGDAIVRFAPHKSSASWGSIQVFSVGGGPQAPRSALPIGAEPSTDPLVPVLVPLSQELVHKVLAVSWAQEEKEILTSNVAGYICVTEVDVLKMKITFLAPSPGALPSSFLLAGSITWLE